MSRPTRQRNPRRALAAAVLLIPSPALATVYDLTGRTINLNTTSYTASDTLTVNLTTFTATSPVTLPAALNAVTYGPSFSTPADVTVTGPITGSTTLGKTGTGTLILAGNNASFTGSADVVNGTLRLASPTALGTGPFPTRVLGLNSTVDLNGFTTPASFNLAGGRLFNDNTTTPVTLNWQFLSSIGADLKLGGAGDMTYAANYPTIAGTLVKYGTGTLTYSTPTKFTSSSQPNIGFGTLRLGMEAPFASSAATTVLINSGATLDLNGFNSPGLRPTLSAGASLVNNNAASLSTLSAFPSTSSIFLGGAGALDFTGTLLTSTSFTKVGSGTLTLSADSTSYAGTITVAAGTLRLGNPAGAGNGPTSANSTVSLSPGGRFDLNGFAPPRLQVTFNGGALVNDNVSSPVTLSSTTLPTLSTGTGPITLGGTGEIIATRSLGSVTKVDPGTLTLSRAGGTISGATVNAGFLRLGRADAIASGTTVTANAGGALDLNGFPMPAGVTLVLADGGVVNNNTDVPVSLTSFPVLSAGKVNPAFGGAGTLTLTLGNLPNRSITLNKVGPGLLTLHPAFIGPFGTKLVDGTLLAETDAQIGGNAGTLTFAGGTLRVAPLSLPDPGSYTLSQVISVDPLAGGTIDTQRDTTLTGSLYGTGTLVKTGTGTLSLTKSLFQAGVGFTVNQGKLNVPFGLSLLDWSFLTLNVDDALPATSIYRLGGLAGSGALHGKLLTLVGAPPSGTTPDSTYSGTFTGGSLTLTGTARLTVTGAVAATVLAESGSLTIGPGGSAQTVVVDTGAAAATVGPGGKTGTVIVNAGSFTIGPDAKTGTIILGNSGAGTVVVNRDDNYTLPLGGTGTLVKLGTGVTSLFPSPTGRLKFDIRAGTLRLDDANAAGQVTALSLTPAASLDLDADRLALNYTGPSPAPAFAQCLLAHQIFSTAVDNDPQHLHTVALAEASVLFNLTGTQTANWFGQILDATSLIFQPTYFGDANMDGVINADDYALLDRSFSAHPAAPQWTDGDFNYDNTIDANDYLLLDRSSFLLSHTAPAPDFLATRESQFGPEYVAALVASVPEPSLVGCGVVAIAAAALRHRRRAALPA